MTEPENFLPLLTIISAMMCIGLIAVFNLDIMQPSVIVSLVMTASLFLGDLTIQRWNLHVGSYTSIVFLTGMLAFYVGSIFVQYYYFQEKTEHPAIGRKQYTDSKLLAFGLTALALCLAYFSFREMYALSVSLGNHDGVMNMIKTVRYPLERQEIRLSRWMAYRELISLAIATVSLYVFIYKTIFEEKFHAGIFLYLFPVFAIIPFFILSTGRRSMVHFILAGCVMASILYQQKYGYTHLIRLRMVKLLGYAGVLSVLGYFAMGFLTGKVSIGGRDPLTIIEHYGGLSVPALDKFLSGIPMENQYLGQNTLGSVYGNLNTLGFHLERGRSFLPFVQFQGIDSITTNVYTVLYRLMADWSFLGMIVVMFVFGVILTLCYNYLKHHSSPLFLVVYAHFGYIPFFLFIDDQFMGILSTYTIYFYLLSAIVLRVMTRTEKEACVDGRRRVLGNE